jgi:hypothetical protein
MLAVGLIGNEAFERDIGLVGIGFQFRKYVFLRTATMVKLNMAM